MKNQNRKRPRRVRRAAVLGLVFSLLLAGFAYQPAEAAALKEEVVYVRLCNDGSVGDVYIVNSFELDKDRQIVDYGNYDYVQNLTNTDALRLEDGAVTLSATGDRMYYEGFLMDPQLPWNISITYLLDGEEIAPEALAGKSGRLEIHIATDLNPLGSCDFFEKYALQVSVSMDETLCRNILADSGTMASAGSNKQISFIVLPGKASELTLSADISDFELPAITIAGVKLNMDLGFDGDMDMSEIRELMDGLAELDDGMQELLDGVFDLHGGAAELHDGASELADGSGDLADGVDELEDGTGELMDGTSELVDGTGELQDGAIELAVNMDDLVDGVRSLDEGVGELADGADDLYVGAGDLYDGASELYDGISKISKGAYSLQSGASDLAAGAAEAASGGSALVGGFSGYFDGIIQLVNDQLADTGLQVTRQNYEQEILEFLYGSAIAQARAAIEEQVYAAAREQILTGVLEGAGMSREVFEALPADDPSRLAIEQTVEEQLALMEDQLTQQIDAALESQMAEIQEGTEENAGELLDLLALLKGYDQLLGGLQTYTGGVSELSGGVSDLSNGITSFSGGLYEYKNGVKKYLGGMKEFYDGTGELADGVDELKDGTVELLDGVIQLRDGVVEFKDGVIELHDGVIELFDGIVELHDGVVELHDGAGELHDGMVQLADGTGELLSGTQDLYDGVAELKDGTGEIRDKTATLDTDIVDGIKDSLKDMMGGDGPVESFASEKNGEIAAVQFVMQTEGISLPETEKAAAEPEPELNVWQRFIHLFRG